MRMSIELWRQMGFTLEWAIYTDLKPDDFASDENAVHGRVSVLDFTANVPDGDYVAVHQGFSRAESMSRIKVRGGQFVPVPTERACLEAVAWSYEQSPFGDPKMDHRYIEGFELNDDNTLTVHMGS